MQTSIIHKIFFLLVLTCILNSFAYAQKKAEQIHELLAHYHMLGRHHGAVLVAQDDEVIYEGGFGLADATWGISNSPDVKYGIGSVTKMFTASCHAANRTWGTPSRRSGGKLPTWLHCSNRQADHC